MKTLNNYYTGETVLFLGNGLNLCCGGLTWGNLLSKINDYFNLNISADGKNFTLLFEELIHLGDTPYRIKLKQVQDFVASLFIEIKAFDLHKQIVALGHNNYLTTNYDYAIEKAIDAKFEVSSNSYTKEFRYSLGRRHEVNGKYIWHIHGEINNSFKGIKYRKYSSQSIMLGFEHYIDYARRLHETIKPTDKPSLTNYLDTKGSKSHWMPFFFTHDIIFIGFGFDYTENHIWWLLSFRHRLLKDMSKMPNKISCYYPCLETNKAKYSLLKSFGVECFEIQCDTHLEFYNKLINDLEEI